MTARSLHPGPDDHAGRSEMTSHGPCWVCGRWTSEIDFDFQAWQHDTCWFVADSQFWAAGLAVDLALADGVAVLL